MAKRFRCPVCGSFGWSSAFDKNYDIECYRQVSLGKAHGFRFETVDDFDLVARVKTKIRMLYMKYFIISDFISKLFAVDYISKPSSYSIDRIVRQKRTIEVI